LKMLLITAQRRGEVAGMTWDEINGTTWSLPSERTKNGRPHDVSLAPEALAILVAQRRYPGSRLVFTATGKPLAGFEGAMLRLKAVMTEIAGKPVEHFTPHDMRRSAASGMARIGIEPHVIDRILNHSSGRISGIARIYNRHEYEPERRA